MASDTEHASSENKRKLEEEDAGEEEWIGPLPSEAAKTKKRKGIK